MIMEASAKPKQVNRNFNKVAYTVFVLAGIYFLIRKDFSSSFTFWAMAPIFDPFDTSIPFQKRPTYQKAWLFIHVIISLLILAAVIFW
ncbi:MAG TPA: hypothetical protein DHW64_01520 [Chitinophagaceae bacterium]|nr:hypothetical protein [Chitinophagaceae bacterium]